MDDVEEFVERFADALVRRDDAALRCHVGLNISAEPNLARLARERGVDRAGG